MVANLQFVSWSRRGIGAAPVVGTDGSRRLVKTRTHVTADRQGQGAPTAVDVDSAQMAILGPGDVIGVAAEQIVRRSPGPDNHNLEPNYLAAVEFAHPDLPWLFSPRDAAGEHLDPWLMLIVLDRSLAQVTVRPASPNPVIVIPDPALVPDPSTAWAWAHVQVHDADAAGATAAVRGDSPVAANIRSRVLCPTRLSPDHDYVAALVPVYEAGRRVGLGQEEADAGAAFWQPSGGIMLPVYDSWRFRTGPSGDFETLARKLHPVTGQALQHLGERLVTIEPRAALMQRDDGSPDVFAPVVHHVPTAIAKSNGPGSLAPDSPAPDAEAEAFHRRLKELVDIVAAASDEAPIVGPPLYGRWPAVVTSLDGDPSQPELRAVPTGQSQTWIEQLNADPYLRAAAGVATQVVQHDQEPLMTDAWSQLSAVLAANSRMRWSRLFASVTGVMHARLSAASAASALRTTSPAFGRVLEDHGRTLRTAVDATTLPREALGSAFMRVARYSVRAATRDTAALSTSAVMTMSSAVEAMRTSAPAVLPARFTTTRAIDPGVLGPILSAPDIAEGIRQRLGTDPTTYLQRIQDVPTDVRRIAARFEVIDVAGPAQGQPADPGELRVRLAIDKAQRVGTLSAVVGGVGGRGPATNIQLRPAVRDELMAFPQASTPVLSLEAVDAVNLLAVEGVAQADEARVDLTSTHVRIDPGVWSKGTLGSIVTASGITQAQAVAVSAADSLRTAALTNLGVYRPTLVDLVGQIGQADITVLRTGFDTVGKEVTPAAAALEVPSLTTFDLATKQTVVTALEPEAAYSKMLAYAHQNVSDAVRRRPRSQFHPAMASPHFPQPLVDRLKVLDEDWVLGGVSKMPPNSICLLAVNWRFVEAFLAGANHEMARELLWRGYPTDLRGSCFRQFWNSPTPDIATMDSWLGDIGEHSESGDRKLTMVVVKGDLLRRYPSTLISAEKGTASADANDPQFTSDNEFGKELFRGFLGGDVTYVALDISIDTLRGEVDDHNRRHSWYISLLEPHDEPRFGLDESDSPATPPNAAPNGDYTKADDWSWQGLTPAGLRHLTPAAVFASESSAIVGASLFQRPFRLLLRAPDYLPPE